MAVEKIYIKEKAVYMKSILTLSSFNSSPSSGQIFGLKLLPKIDSSNKYTSLDEA
jgi:hypothetical protein